MPRAVFASFFSPSLPQVGYTARLWMLPALLLFWLGSPLSARAQMEPSLQMPLGNPDKAQTVSKNRDHFLMQRNEFALSYNDALRFPNWVAWHLSKQDVGQTERGVFAPDMSLPQGFTVVLPSDYTRSGYDRGHNCPSKDRSDTRKNNDAVFLMTNMTPQAHGMNAGPWAGLENYSRDLAFADNELLIYCGHGFSTSHSPRVTDGAPTHKTIGRAGVAVPDFGWKIVVVVPPGAGSLVSRVTPTSRVIAVKMPNINTVSKKDWREYRTSVQDIEAATGLVFFDKLPKATADALKNRVDFDRSAPSRMRPAPTPPTFPSGGKVTNVNTGATLPGASTDVWVNLSSGVYWKPGTSYYGKTKRGKYMSEADAIKAGYHAPKGQ